MLITVKCNQCGSKSIYKTDDTDITKLTCKACKSADIKKIKNPGEKKIYHIGSFND